MTGMHSESITRRRALAVTGGTVAAGPVAAHSGSCTTLDDDMVYDGSGAAGGLLTLKAAKKADPARGHRGFHTLGIDPDAENAGGGGGEGGTPPSGEPPADAPTVGATGSGTAS